MSGPRGKYFAPLRREYGRRTLDTGACDPSPFKQFSRWLDEASRAGLIEPNAMALATADSTGQPSVRMVLLKTFDERGMVFFTNYESRKGRELADNPRGALLFYWDALERQVRIEGAIERTKESESDDYFATRPRGARLGAHASRQSEVIRDRAALEKTYEKLDAEFKDKEVPRPDFWGGYRLVPHYFEFWQGRENKLHDRISYTLAGKSWHLARLSP
jgi:pyridoxamine 5'-phosphate oxidase